MKKTQMQNKTCVITGGSNGIGKATAMKLASMGASVVIICRSPERGKIAHKEIIEKTGNENIELVFADLAIQSEVRRAAAEVLENHEQIHVLINNAAVLLPTREITADGIEKMFATNYLSHFLLTNLFLDRLKASAPARIVTVANLIPGAKIDLDDLNLENIKYSSFGALRPSKLALILFTRELAKRLQGTGVTANVLEPGLSKTTMMDQQSWFMRTFIHLISGKPEKGARTSIYLASHPEVEGITGKYFAKCKEKPISGEQVDDETLWKELWDKSIELTQLKQQYGIGK